MARSVAVVEYACPVCIISTMHGCISINIILSYLILTALLLLQLMLLLDGNVLINYNYHQCRIKVGAIDAAALGPFVK